MKKAESPTGKSGLNAWLKRIGWLGFLFFLIKGLFWLYLIYWVGRKI